MIKELRYRYNRFLVDKGLRTREDALSSVLGKEGDEVVKGLKYLKTKRSLSTPVENSVLMQEAEEEFNRILERKSPEERQKAIGIMAPYGTGTVGFEQKGSVLRKLYPSIFQTVAFVCDNYWAIIKSRQLVRTEVIKDGQEFQTLGTYSKKKIRMCWDILEELGLLTNADEMVDQLNCYANCWLREEKNLLGGTIRYEILQPERIKPEWDIGKSKILGWWYEENGSRHLYAKDELIHLKTFSARTQEMGSPALSSVILDIEASMFATAYNNGLFQSGGLTSNVLTIRPELIDKGIIKEGNSVIAELAQLKWDKTVGGLKGAGKTIISPIIDKNIKLVQPGELDGTHKHLVEQTDKRCCLLQGVSPDMLHQPISSQYQDKGLTANRVEEAFDAHVWYLSSIVYSFFTRVLQEKLGVYDIIVTAGGSFKQSSKNGAEWVDLLTQNNGVITRDEARMVLKLPTVGGEEGRQWVQPPAPALKEGEAQPDVGEGPDVPVTRFLHRTKGITVHPGHIIKTYEKWG
jgi:hypothetical protein